MTYVIQLLPNEVELTTLKNALREYTFNHTSSEPLTDVAWGILADIHKKEMDNRDREAKRTTNL